jgi:hypothetical protein
MIIVVEFVNMQDQSAVPHSNKLRKSAKIVGQFYFRIGTCE